MKLNTEFFTDKGLLSPHGENDILFTAEYCILNYNAGTESVDELRALLTMAAESLRVGDKFEALPEEPWSHDNHTGLLCASKVLGLDYHKKFFYDGWYRRIHPRDIVYYLYLKGGIVSFFAWFFLIIPSIAMIVNAINTYKYNNNEKLVATDGKLLAWCRFNATYMPITQFLCTLFLRNNSEFGSWKKCFEIYFKDVNHPNRKFRDEVYSPQYRG